MSTAAVIVTFNGSDWIRSCLSSCLMCSGVTEVIVVDNGSSDETCAIVANDFPQVTLIRLEENTGFGHANNVGIVHALRSDPDGVMLVNQDATLDRSCVSVLEKAGAAHPDFGLFSPLHLNYSGSGIHRGFLKYIVMSCQALIDDCVLSKPKDLYEFANAPAALWWIPRRALKKVGGFDPLFFVYCEDADYVNRVLGAGYRCALVPEAIGMHDDSPGTPSVFKECELLLSQQLILLKNSKSMKRDSLRVIKRLAVSSTQALTSLQFDRSWRLLMVLPRICKMRENLRRSRLLLHQVPEYCFLDLDKVPRKQYA